MRLVGPNQTPWENRAHFFGAAARAIRRILTDHARERTRNAGKPTILEAALLNDIGAAHKALGDFDSVIATHREALTAKAIVYPSDPLPAAYSHHNMGDALLRQ